MANLWECDEPIATTFGSIDVPPWIDQDISPYTVASIIKGGCESGAYMPAVTYHIANETMTKHGDDVLQFIDHHIGELPQCDDNQSWSGMACFYLSYAVGIWASNVEPELETLMDELETADA